MVRKSILAAGAALSLVGATAQAATPVRAPATVDAEAEGLTASPWWVLGFAAIAAGLVILISDGNDSPTSP